VSEDKIRMCREYWQGMSAEGKERPTAKFMIAAIEIAEKLIRENNRLEMECRQLRLNAQHERSEG